MMTPKVFSKKAKQMTFKRRTETGRAYSDQSQMQEEQQSFFSQARSEQAHSVQEGWSENQNQTSEQVINKDEVLEPDEERPSFSEEGGSINLKENQKH